MLEVELSREGSMTSSGLENCHGNLRKCYEYWAIWVRILFLLLDMVILQIDSHHQPVTLSDKPLNTVPWRQRRKEM